VRTWVFMLTMMTGTTICNVSDVWSLDDDDFVFLFTILGSSEGTRQDIIATCDGRASVLADLVNNRTRSMKSFWVREKASPACV